MSQIELILSNPKKPESVISLFYKVDGTEISKKYFDCLKQTIKKNISIFEPDRFYNFPYHYKNKDWIAEQLNKAIDTINHFKPDLIQRKAVPDMDQDLMNYLHHYFESYRGEILNPNEFFATAPKEVKAALEDFNLLIHRYEDFRFNERMVANGHGRAAKIVLTFDWQRSRHEFSDSDYLQFTRQITFGKWYINYCEVGKQIWDVYLDNDNIIGDQNIKPLRYYSADAMIEFSPTTPAHFNEKQLLKFWDWWDTKSDQFEKLGFKKYDPKNAIGLVPVATLIRDQGQIENLTDHEIIELIGHHQYMKQVRVHE